MKTALLLVVLAAAVAVAYSENAASVGTDELLQSGAGASRKLKYYYATTGYQNPGVPILLPIADPPERDSGEGGGNGGGGTPVFVELFEAFTGILGDVLQVTGNVLGATVFND